MDLSAVIFLAVAVAWAAYLVPKALRHHDEADRSRSVERFSHTMRVLARRDAVSARDTRLVVPQPARRPPAGESADGEPDPGQDDPHEPEEAPAPPTAAQIRARRLAAGLATRRRRRVFGLLLAANALVGALVALGVVGVIWPAVPAGLLAAWLLSCRVMVRREHAAWAALTTPRPAPPHREARPHENGPHENGPHEDGPHEDGPHEDGPDQKQGEDDVVAPAAHETEANGQGFGEVAAASDTTAQEAVASRPRVWDPVPVTLPTYVHKAAAVRRSVRTIDLDATGVWTSGRTDEDARIAQATAKRVAGEAGGDADRAVGT